MHARNATVKKVDKTLRALSSVTLSVNPNHVKLKPGTASPASGTDESEDSDGWETDLECEEVIVISLCTLTMNTTLDTTSNLNIVGLLERPFYKSLESHHDLNRLQAVPPFQRGPSHDSKKLCDKRIMELLSVCLSPRVQNGMPATIPFFPFFFMATDFTSCKGLLEVYYLTPFIFSLLKVQLI